MRGFTLVELLVSITLFLIVIVVVVSVFLTTLAGERRAFAERRALDALRAGLEMMARELRTGTGFPTGCASACSSLAFTNDEGRAVSYNMSSGCVMRSVGGASSCITPRQVSIERLGFIVVGSSSGDSLQPRITLTLTARSRVGREEALFHLATSVSQRELDF